MSNSIYDISWMLGNYLDGWADLIEGKGNQSLTVKIKVIEQLRQRGMPNVEVGEVAIKEGFLSGKTRAYMETKTAPGVRTIIYIEEQGPDLYASWRSYMRPTINWQLIGIYLEIAVAVSAILNSLGYLFNVIQGINALFNVGDWGPYHNAFSSLIFIIISVSFLGICFIAVAGKIIRREYSYYFENNNSFAPIFMLFTIGLAIYLGTSYNNNGSIIKSQTDIFYSGVGMVFSYFSFSYWATVGYAISLFLGILVLAAIFGLFFRRNLLAFITKEPSVFDADNILAMNLSVHKTILRVLDEVGIGTSKLRLKNQFKGGRSGETV